MENKNNALTAVICLVTGLFVGFLVWGTSNRHTISNQEKHMMSDGSMMENESMNMHSMMSEMNDALAGKKDDAFDQAFIREMIVHHEGAVDMAELALANAKHQEIKTLANAIISAQTTEINQMNLWLQNWYGISQ